MGYVNVGNLPQLTLPRDITNLVNVFAMIRAGYNTDRQTDFEIVIDFPNFVRSRRGAKDVTTEFDFCDDVLHNPRADLRLYTVADHSGDPHQTLPYGV